MTNEISPKPEILVEAVAFIDSNAEKLGLPAEEVQAIKSHLSANTIPADLQPELVTEASKVFIPAAPDAAADSVTETVESSSDTPVVAPVSNLEVVNKATDRLKKENAESNDLRYILGKATIAQKLKLAIFGNAACRALLIMDTNQMISSAVLRNPRMQLGEVEGFCKNPFMSDFILAQFADSRVWTSSYLVKKNLVCNPKTPQHASLKFIRYLLKQDLAKISKSREVPQAVVNGARRRISDIEKGK